MSFINTLKELFGFRSTRPEPKKNKPAPQKEKPESWVRYTHHDSQRYIIYGSRIFCQTTGHSIYKTQTEIFELNKSFVICQTHYDGEQYVKPVAKPCSLKKLAEIALSVKAPKGFIDRTAMKQAFAEAGYLDDDSIILQ